MLTEAIMHDCVVKLLKNHDEESLECLCRLLTTIGKDLDFEKAKVRPPNLRNLLQGLFVSCGSWPSTQVSIFSQQPRVLFFCPSHCQGWAMVLVTTFSLKSEVKRIQKYLKARSWIEIISPVSFILQALHVYMNSSTFLWTEIWGWGGSYQQPGLTEDKNEDLVAFSFML